MTNLETRQARRWRCAKCCLGARLGGSKKRRGFFGPPSVAGVRTPAKHEICVAWLVENQGDPQKAKNIKQGEVSLSLGCGPHKLHTWGCLKISAPPKKGKSILLNRSNRKSLEYAKGTTSKRGSILQNSARMPLAPCRQSQNMRQQHPQQIKQHTKQQLHQHPKPHAP